MDSGRITATGGHSAWLEGRRSAGTKGVTDLALRRQGLCDPKGDGAIAAGNEDRGIRAPGRGEQGREGETLVAEGCVVRSDRAGSKMGVTMQLSPRLRYDQRQREEHAN